MRKQVAVAIVGVLALAACGGSSSKGSNPTTNGGSNNSKSNSNDFSALIAKTNKATYKVTYQSGSETPFTIAQDPPRFSYTTDSSGTYVTADGSAVSCSGTGPTATCTSLPGGGAAIQQGLTTSFGAIGALLVSQAGKGIPGLASITKTTSKTIAGRDAVCATIDASSLGVLGAAIGKGSYSVCADKATGVMLESRSDDGNGHVTDVRATAFGTPSAADLTPPATPVTIPGLTPST
jgi:hypothetical protein